MGVIVAVLVGCGVMVLAGVRVDVTVKVCDGVIEGGIVWVEVNVAGSGVDRSPQPTVLNSITRRNKVSRNLAGLKFIIGDSFNRFIQAV